MGETPTIVVGMGSTQKVGRRNGSHPSGLIRHLPTK